MLAGLLAGLLAGMARMGGWLVGMGMDEMAGKQGDDCKKNRQKAKKKKKKKTYIADVASIVASTSGVVAGIAYVTAVIVVAHVITELLYLKKLALKKKRKTPKNSTSHSLGWWVMSSLRWLGIIYKKKFSI